MSVKIRCDFCDKPLVIDEEKLIFKTYTTKELNTKKMFPNLCENCAMKLDDALRYARGEWAKSGCKEEQKEPFCRNRREKTDIC